MVLFCVIDDGFVRWFEFGIIYDGFVRWVVFCLGLFTMVVRWVEFCLGSFTMVLFVGFVRWFVWNYLRWFC